jgi:hypothetical protein
MVEKAGRKQLDGAKYFQGIFLASGGDFWLASYPGPGLIEGGVLPEAGFVFEEKGRPFALGFFLISG